MQSMVLRACRGNESCRHGFSQLDPNHSLGRLMSTFMDAFTTSWDEVTRKETGGSRTMGKIVGEVMEQTHRECPEVWMNDDYRAMAADSLVRLGTDMLLSKEANLFKDDIIGFYVGPMALAIKTLEQGLGVMSLSAGLLPEKERLKLVDIIDGCHKSVIQFYADRTKCSCLDEKYHAIQSMAKTGVCQFCRQRKERSKLLMCSACKFHQYVSTYLASL